jgi:hypothetical protein
MMSSTSKVLLAANAAIYSLLFTEVCTISHIIWPKEGSVPVTAEVLVFLNDNYVPKALWLNLKLILLLKYSTCILSPVLYGVEVMLGSQSCTFGILL